MKQEGFPVLPLAGVLILTAGLCACLAWSSLHAYYGNAKVQERHLRFLELQGIILRLDEVLTMSARMAAATGSTQWEDRYRQFEPQLDSAIKEAMLIESSEAITLFAAQTDAANEKLVEMEHRAFDLVQRSRLEEARTLLASQQYEEEKKRYSNGMSEMMALMDKGLHASQEAEYRKTWSIVLAALAGAALAIWAWAVVLRSLRRWQRALTKAVKERTHAEEKLREHQTQLELRVQERTAELTAEVDQRKKSEALLRVSEERYRIIFESSADALMTLDANGFLDCNPATLKLFGCAKESEFLSLHPSQVSPPCQPDGMDSKTAANNRIAVAFEKGINRFEWRHCRKNGEEFPVEVWLTAFSLGGRQVLQATVRDLTARKRSEEALQESEDRFRAIFDNALDGIVVADVASRKFLFGNRSIHQMLGYTPEELRALGVTEIHPQEDLPQVIETFDKQARQELGTTALPVQRKDGSVFYADIRSFPVTLAGRACLAGVFRDISERKRDEEQLRLQGAALESAANGVVITDRAGTILWANTAFTRLTGYDVREALGKNPRELVKSGKQTPTFYKDMWEAILAGSVWHGEVINRRKDGSLYTEEMTITPVRDERGALTHFVAIKQDITERKRAEDALRNATRQAQDAANKTEAIIAALGDGMTIQDRNFRIIFQNEAHRRMRGDQVGRLCYEAYEHKSAVCEGCAVSRAFDDGAVHLAERIVVDEKGKRHYEITASPLRNAAGELVAGIELVRDITARKRAQEELLAAKEAAVAANRAKSTFLANMSHELRTPLNSVIGFANVLLRNGDHILPKKDRLYLERIQANGQHLLELINTLLDLSKVEAGRMELELAPLKLDALVRDTVAELQGQVQGPCKSVKLLAELPPAVKCIHADGAKLKQVLINLVGNALKFTSHGSVTVRLACDDTGLPCRIDVVDTGIGIPRDRTAVIFEAFQQAENGTTRKYGGTGLGLTISRALCQLMGYSISVNSEVGKGSTFTIQLANVSAAPLPSASEAAMPLTRIASRKSRTKARQPLVLVIDDDSELRAALARRFAELECHVMSASSVQEGLRMARENKPGLIALDCMPRMNGWVALSQLQGDPELKDIPVVIVSAAAEGEGLEGVVDYISKPVTVNALRGVLARHTIRTPAKILVVDDEEDDRRLMLACLAEEGYDSRTAVNGREALLMLESCTPDLIVLDLMMPGMDGMTFLETIRKDPRYADIPVVVVTSKDLKLCDRRKLSAETSGVLGKCDILGGGLGHILHEVLGNGKELPCSGSRARGAGSGTGNEPRTQNPEPRLMEVSNGAE